MVVFEGAGRKVKTASGKRTWLEVIHRGNMAGRRVMPRTFFTRALLEKEKGQYKIPDPDLRRAEPVYSGTFGMVGPKGKKLGDRIEAECDYDGKKKVVIVSPRPDEAVLVDKMLTCDHGFRPDSTPFLLLSDARTERPITTHGAMTYADEVILRLNGPTHVFGISDRRGGVIETFGNEDILLWAPESAVIGLLSFFHYSFNADQTRRTAMLINRSHDHFEAIRDDNESLVGTQKLDIVTRDGGLVTLRGSNEQILEALRVLRSHGLF